MAGQDTRFVAVDVDDRRGSGYVITDSLVLTSAHVVGDVATTATVYRPGFDGRYEGEVVWRGKPGGVDDAALVSVPEWDVLMGAAPHWGRVVTTATGIACETRGVPDVVQGGPAREVAHLSGRLNSRDGFVADTYVMQVDGVPPESMGRSPWSGLSGAPMFCGDLLTGVLRADPAGWQHSRLTVTPSYVLLADPDFAALVTASGGSPTAVPVEWQKLAIHADQPVGKATSPAALLVAQREVVPFQGRESLLSELRGWARAPGFGARLVCGRGGQGKTRLAQEFARSCAEQRWAVVWLDAGASEAEVAKLADAAVPVLVIVDYAESRGRQLENLVATCGRHRGPQPMKLLLLARTKGFWWSELLASSDDVMWSLENVEVDDLPVLDSGDEDRRAGYAIAVRALAERLEAWPEQAQSPWRRIAEELAHDRPAPRGADTVLEVHMTALVDLLDRAAAAGGTATGGMQVEDRLLLHEFRHCKETGTAHGVCQSVGINLLLDTVAAVALSGVVDRRDAAGFLDRLPGLADQPFAVRADVGRWLSAVYPSGDDRPWATLQPDRLAERLVGRRITDHYGAADRLVAIRDDPAEAVQLLTTYSRAASHAVFGTELAESLTRLCVEHSAVLAVPAIAVATRVEAPQPLLDALEAISSDPATPVESLAAMVDSVPSRTQVLAGWATALAARLVDRRRAIARAEPGLQARTALASALGVLSARLGAAGRPEEALAAAEEAVAERRATIAEYMAFHLEGLGAGLNELSNRLIDVGRGPDAAGVIDETIEVFRALRVMSPGSYDRELAAAVANRAARYLKLADYATALAAGEEALAGYRWLLDNEPESRHGPVEADLANCRNTVAAALFKLGRTADAKEMAEAAAAGYRSLAGERPDAYNIELARTLNTVSNMCSATGDHETALHAAEEAVAIARQLPDERMAAVGADLVTPFITRAATLARMGRLDQAVAADTEVIAILRPLAGRWPDRFDHELAIALGNASGRQSLLGHADTAVAMAAEAVEIARGLTGEVLADRLIDLSKCLLDSARWEEARTAASEAVTVLRSTGQRSSVGELTGRAAEALSKALSNLSAACDALGRAEDSLVAIESAVALYRDWLRTQPAEAVEPQLALLMSNKATALAKLERYQEGLDAAAAAVDMHRALASRNEGFLPELARALQTSSFCHLALERQTEALTLAEESVEIHRTITRNGTTAFRHTMSGALVMLAAAFRAVGEAAAAAAADAEAAELVSRSSG